VRACPVPERVLRKRLPFCVFWERSRGLEGSLIDSVQKYPEEKAGDFLCCILTLLK
jgi:hypothetical protein